MSGRILIVEDEPELLIAMAEFFEARGYEVHNASEREEAETLLQTYTYSVVVTDLALPCLANPNAMRPKLVAITGESLDSAGDVIEALLQEKPRKRV
jgi:DNA-binding response OmpR family regulator